MSHQQEEKSTPFVVSNLYWQYTLVENGRSVASGKIVYLSLQNPGRDYRLLPSHFSPTHS